MIKTGRTHCELHTGAKFAIYEYDFLVFFCMEHPYQYQQ